MMILMMNISIHFEIFGEKKALFDQIVGIFDWIVVIYRPMCKQIFPIKMNSLYKKISAFGHYSFQFDSKYIK